MTVRWSVLAVGLCWLAPFAHDPAREHGFSVREIEPASPAVRPVSLITTDIGKLPANTPENWGVPSVSRGSHNARALTAYGAVFRQLFGSRFLFRNQERLTPFGNVLFGGVRAAGRAAPISIAAATKRQ